MEIKFSDRLAKLPPYLFADLRRKIAAKRKSGAKVITLGIGDPDKPTPDAVIDELTRTIKDSSDPDRHRYGCDAPVEQFAKSARDFYRKRWNVQLSEEQIVTTCGSKDAIAKLPLGMMNPGDIGISPQPGYPTYNIGHVFAGGGTYYAPLSAENDFLMDFDAIPPDVAQAAKILWLNYPNNPTTAIATEEFFARAVEFGRANNILIAHDAAYSANTFDGYKPPSILQVPGAEDTAVEFFSLSKAFNMTGWRAGFMVGNASAVNVLQTVKENIDNGSLRAVQFASARALDLADEILPEINAVYASRRDFVCDALNAAGWNIKKPLATIYIWAPVPEKYNKSSDDPDYSASLKFAQDLLEKAGVVITPGRGYGPTGEGFFRISLTYPDDVLKEAIEKIIAM